MLPKAASFTALVMLLSTSANAADMTGSSDHPSLPRVTGSEILGHAFNDYDAGNFLVEDADDKVVVEQTEGRRTRILYLAKAGDTPLKIQKNYETALEELGAVDERYSCSADGCNRNMIANTLWSRDTMIPTEGLKHPFYLLGFAHTFTTPAYRFATVTTDSNRFHIGVMAAEIAANNSNKELAGRVVALVEIVEEADFEATLEFVDAAQMQSEITTSGRVALYGILFDTDAATLKAESQATLAEIVSVLKDNSLLSIYVVGHTDDVGALDYNQDLSQRRAVAVTDALVAQGISRDRLTPLGAGPMAPVASNATEDGRALNRRVELVGRHGGR